MHDGLSFAVIELLEGETLRGKLAGGPRPPRKAVEYALQVCHGLASAHEKGIVSGKASLWKELLPADATGVVRIPAIAVTADGRGYLYTFNNRLSEL